MYVVIFGLSIFVLLTEQADWKCPGVTNYLFNCQGEGGMPYRGAKPSQSDTCSQLLSKINLAASSSSKSIKWRRSFLLAVLIALLVFVLVVTPGKLPSWTQFYITVIIITTIFYFNLNYHDYHKLNIPRDYIAESSALIEEKIRKGECR